MPIRIPVVLEISDEGLATLRGAGDFLPADDQPSSVVTPPDDDIVISEEWRQIDESSGVRYTWGEDQDIYDPFITYECSTRKGKARMGIGKCRRTQVRGMDRIYYIVINIGPEGGMRAIAEFLATDDYDKTGEVIAIIRGKEGSARQFDSMDELPSIYRAWDTVTYRDRVDYPRSYLKQGLICKEHDHETMLNHSLVQIQLRDL